MEDRFGLNKVSLGPAVRTIWEVDGKGRGSVVEGSQGRRPQETWETEMFGVTDNVVVE